MPKRKRQQVHTLDQTLLQCRTQLVRALKTAKGFDRQRLSKRLNEDGITEEKSQRLEREVAVLKSLDLDQTANAHLCSSLTRIKSIASHPDLPESIRAGVPKHDAANVDRLAMHHVTSNLFNRDHVKSAMEKAIADICNVLELPLPEKKRSRRRENARVGEVEDQKPAAGARIRRDGLPASAEGGNNIHPRPLLEGSADDNAAPEWDKSDDGRRGKTRSDIKSVKIRNMSISVSPSPPPEAVVRAPPQKRTRPVHPEPVKNSTFLPTLMGGYISGSESASDVDVAPSDRKNRRGQRARQAIWEKKYGEGAKHRQKQQSKGEASWDMRRGAIFEDEDPRQRRPWKKGINNPLSRNDAYTNAGSEPAVTSKIAKESESPLHPSWEAKKKAKEREKAMIVAPANKIVFDD